MKFNSRLCIASMIAAVGALAATDDPALIRRFADEHVGRWSNSGRGLPAWRNARTDEVVPIQAGATTLHVCRLKTDGKDAGYVLLRAAADGYQPIMWSASDFPQDYINAFSIHQAAGVLPDEPCPAIVQLQPGMSMVGIPENTPEDLRPSSLACCAISVIYWMETQAQEALLYSYQRRSSLPPRLSGPFFVKAAEQTGNELSEFHEQWSDMYSDPDLYETVAGPSGTPSYRRKDAAGVFRRVGPSIRSNLQRSLSQRARLQLLERECNLGLDIGQGKISPGAVNAVALQAFLADNPGTGLNDFMASRGLLLRWAEKPASALDSVELPCVAVGPDNQALLIAGTFGDSRDWLVVCAPSTVRPDELPILEGAERLRQHVLRRVPRNDPSAQLFRQKSEEYRKEAAAGQAQPDGKPEERLLHDPDLGLPAGMANGLHVLTKTLVGNWKLLCLVKDGSQETK